MKLFLGLQIQIKVSEIKIPKIISFILLCSYLFPYTDNQLESEIHIPMLQQLSMISQLQFDDLKSSHLDQGYNLLEECIKLEIKSNTSWLLVVYNETPIDHNKFFLKTHSSTFMPLTEQKTQLISSNQPTASTLISIDCRRTVNWNNSQPKEWSFSPIFQLAELE